MKVSPIDLDRLIFAIAPIDTAETRVTYRTLQKNPRAAVKDIDMRYRWDLYWAATALGFAFSKDTYLDAHIDTALRRAVPPLSEG